MLLNLDVGFATMGWSVIDKGKLIDCGVIVTEKSTKKTARVADDYAARSGFIARSLCSIVDLHKVKGVVGELPSGGAQNASAMAKMAMAIAVTAGTFELLLIPCEWCTPRDVKLAAVNNEKASKPEMMAAMIEKFGGKTTEKQVKKKSGAVRTDLTYHICGHRFGSGLFEHIADSLGAYLASRTGNLAKMFG